MFECDFCKKKYTSVSSLNLHQKTAKFCIKLQQQTGINIDAKTIECEYCNKTFLVKQSLEIHMKSCKNKDYKKSIDLENECIQLKKTIEKLQEENKKLLELSKSSTTTNNTTNNITNNIIYNGPWLIELKLTTSKQ